MYNTCVSAVILRYILTIIVGVYYARTVLLRDTLSIHGGLAGAGQAEYDVDAALLPYRTAVVGTVEAALRHCLFIRLVLNGFTIRQFVGRRGAVIFFNSLFDLGYFKHLVKWHFALVQTVNYACNFRASALFIILRLLGVVKRGAECCGGVCLHSRGRISDRLIDFRLLCALLCIRGHFLSCRILCRGFAVKLAQPRRGYARGYLFARHGGKCRLTGFVFYAPELFKLTIRDWFACEQRVEYLGSLYCVLGADTFRLKGRSSRRYHDRLRCVLRHGLGLLGGGPRTICRAERRRGVNRRTCVILAAFLKLTLFFDHKTHEASNLSVFDLCFAQRSRVVEPGSQILGELSSLRALGVIECLVDGQQVVQGLLLLPAYNCLCDFVVRHTRPYGYAGGNTARDGARRYVEREICQPVCQSMALGVLLTLALRHIVCDREIIFRSVAHNNEIGQSIGDSRHALFRALYRGLHADALENIRYCTLARGVTHSALDSIKMLNR